jgi:hypothetical protein
MRAISTQMLAYAGTGAEHGSWLAMEDLTSSQGSDNDFDDAVLFLESVNPTRFRQPPGAR